MKNKIELLCEEYGGKQYKNEWYFLLDGYHVTLWTADNAYKAALELPLIKPEQVFALRDELSAAGFDISPEYNVPALEFDLPNDADLSDLFACIKTKLAELDCPKDVCTYCRKGNAQTDMLLNGRYCLLHDGCIEQMRQYNKYGDKTPAKRVIGGLALALPFAVAGGLSYILFAHYEIMPALGGIAMGLLGALGYRIINKNARRGVRVALFFMFLVLACGCNMLADKLYLNASGIDYDFTTTYTDPLNLFNTAFDVIAGAIIASCSTMLVFDFDHYVNTYTLKKPEGGVHHK